LAERLGVSDVRPALARFAAGLDAGWIQEVAACARDYLATCGERHQCRQRGWN
jgi:hypothetical protein